MKNFEKYEKELKEKGFRDLALDKKTLQVKSCDCDCGRCLFDLNNLGEKCSCSDNKIEWLYEEYKEPDLKRPNKEDFMGEDGYFDVYLREKYEEALDSYCNELERLLKALCKKGDRRGLIRAVCDYKCCEKFKDTEEWTDGCLNCLMNNVLNEFIKMDKKEGEEIDEN